MGLLTRASIMLEFIRLVPLVIAALELSHSVELKGSDSLNVTQGPNTSPGEVEKYRFQGLLPDCLHQNL
jgi:hypothetical protein